ncbi:MAG TPA: LptA/OstA family protein, partial [Microvirga sp.]|nr:LptA/OstA family protein [Microvirga sp.]
MKSLARHALALALLVPAATSAAWAQASKERAVGFGNFGSSKEPIKIDANKLDVFDKEGRAVFSGDVVAVQGESTMKCTSM